MDSSTLTSTGNASGLDYAGINVSTACGSRTRSLPHAVLTWPTLIAKSLKLRKMRLYLP
jgi:hypothetical protein